MVSKGWKPSPGARATPLHRKPDRTLRPAQRAPRTTGPQAGPARPRVGCRVCGKGNDRRPDPREPAVLWRAPWPQGTCSANPPWSPGIAGPPRKTHTGKRRPWGASISAQANGWCDCAKTSELEDGTPVADQYNGGDLGSAYYQCRGSRFLVGMWFNCNNALYCLEQYKCCRPCSFTGQ